METTSMTWELKSRRRKLELGGGATRIMGILNATPDSFSDGGKYDRVDAAVARALQMIEEGADVIDIGGESTRPNHEPVDAAEELRRVIPVIEAVRRVTDAPISIDTYKAEVARKALEAGADIVNDVWGGLADPDILRVAAEYEAPIILMHNRVEASGYRSLVDDVLADLRARVDAARAAGVPDRLIMLDPGIGFAKTYEENLKLMNHLHRIRGLGFPVLLGTSRKSMIRLTIGGSPDEVLEGTIATTVIGVMQGCEMVRVHDVHANRQAARMADGVRNKR